MGCGVGWSSGQPRAGARSKHCAWGTGERERRGASTILAGAPPPQGGRTREEGRSQAPHLPTPTGLYTATAERAENTRLFAEDGEWAGLEGRGFRVWPDHPAHSFLLTWFIFKQIEPVFLVSMDKKNAVLRKRAWGRDGGWGQG